MWWWRRQRRSRRRFYTLLRYIDSCEHGKNHIDASVCCSRESGIKCMMIVTCLYVLRSYCSVFTLLVVHALDEFIEELKIHKWRICGHCEHLALESRTIVSMLKMLGKVSGRCHCLFINKNENGEMTVERWNALLSLDVGKQWCVIYCYS